MPLSSTHNTSWIERVSSRLSNSCPACSYNQPTYKPWVFLGAGERQRVLPRQRLPWIRSQCRKERYFYRDFLEFAVQRCYLKTTWSALPPKTPPRLPEEKT